MKNVVAPAGTHTHTAPPRPVTKAPPAGFGGEGDASAATQVAAPARPPVFLFALKSPAPLIVLAVIVAASGNPVVNLGRDQQVRPTSRKSRPRGEPLRGSAGGCHRRLGVVHRGGAEQGHRLRELVRPRPGCAGDKGAGRAACT